MVFSEKCAMDVKWNSGTLHITRKVDAALFSTLSSAMGGWWQGVARGALPLLAGGAYPGLLAGVLTLGRTLHTFTLHSAI